MQRAPKIVSDVGACSASTWRKIITTIITSKTRVRRMLNMKNECALSWGSTMRSNKAGLAIVIIIAGLLAGCSGRGQVKTEPTPDTRVDLSARGLPNGFFRADADTKCGGQIIGYRFVVWLDSQSVAVGFSTSPNCRPLSG